MERAIHLRYEQNLSWASVCERLNIDSAVSFRVMVSRYRNGRMGFAHLEWAKRREEIERLYLQGVSLADIGRKLGIRSSGVKNILNRIGLDAETRAEILQDRAA
jgi:hypothetical protein